MSADREAVIETCVRLSWNIDRQDWDKVAALLADRVRVDYTSVNGGEPATYRPGEFVKGLSAVLGALDATQHVQSGHLVDLDGDRAVCLSNVLGFHRLANRFGAHMRTVGGRYRFALARGEDGRWRIDDWTFELSWADGNPGIMALAHTVER